MNLDTPTQVWNRANQYPGVPAALLGPGDRALRDLALVHNAIQNGGLSHAFDLLTVRDRETAAAGYLYFGFDDAAQWLREAEESPDDDELLGRLDGLFFALDDELLPRFRVKFEESPHEFAPL